MTTKIDISPEQLAIVQGILKDHLPKGTLAWAFGSRVTWTAKPLSDLDIALEGTAPLAPDVLIDLEEAFEASDLPWKVDVIDLNAVSPEFRAIVERQRVPADWATVALDDVANLSGGFAFKSSQYTEEGRFVLRTVNIDENYSITRENANYISEDDAKNFERFSLGEHDTLFVMVAATLGKIGYVRQRDLPALLNQNMWVIRAKRGKIDPIFLHYLFREISKIPLSWVGGSARSFLRRDDVRNLEFQLPTEAEQALIGRLLKALDDKIELNRRMNETLEAMARAVFRDWFVDFGPTRRKAAGLTDPAAILGGLLPDPTQAPPLAALFPDSFGANGLPEGWEVREVGDLCPIVGGGTPSTKEPAFWDGGTHNWATPKDLSKLSGLFLRETERQVTDAGLAKVSSGLSPVGSVLLSSRAPIGYVAIAEKPVSVNQGFIVMQPTPAFPTEFAYFWTLENLDLIKANANGSTFQEISKKNFRPLRVNHSGEALVAKFAEVAGPMMALIRNNEQENQTLAATRDLLLPKLMSGELRLTGTEGAL